MKFRSLVVVLLLTQLALPVLAQQPQSQQKPAAPSAPQQPERQADDDTVKITTNLVQVDAIVTDKNGKQITDLSADEVEITEDDRPQKITNFSYISIDSPRVATRNETKPSDRNTPPIPPSRIKPENVRRTIALVVDDLGLSFQSVYHVRRALTKFLEEQMQPGDLVAIIRTSGGIGALQQFTSDKRQLYAAIDKVKWSVTSRSGVSTFAPLTGAEAVSEKPPESGPIAAAHEDFDQFREDLYAVGTLGALNYVVNGLRNLPGRKSVVLLSDGINIFNTTKEKVMPKGSQRVMSAMQRLIDLANRASVIVYTIDARGLPTFGLNAADDTAGLSAGEVDRMLAERKNGFDQSQAGLGYLAEETGGMAIKNNNDLGAGIKQIMADQSGYYLIGYRPDESTFDKTGRTKFHKLALHVKRPGKYEVRMRSGFIGVSGDEPVPQPHTREQQLLGALVSPFGAEKVHLHSTSLFARDPKGNPMMRSLVHVDPHDLTFTTEPDGTHKTSFDILAVTFGDNGQVVDQIGRTHTLRLKDKTYERIMNTGLIYNVAVPIKRPGAYQLRTALRDVASERVGSTSQFVEVPDLKKKRLTLSGVLVKGVPLQTYLKSARGSATANENTDDTVEETDADANAAVRRFKSGMVMLYGLAIYNAQIDKQTGKPKLQTQMRLFRDGKLVFTGKEVAFDPADQPDMKQLNTLGAMQLGTELEPGEYVLQLVVTDLLDYGKYRLASQWIDFEIVK